MKCSLDFCEAESRNKKGGLCSTHYSQKWRGLPYTPSRKKKKYFDDICEIDFCDRLAKKKNKCAVHYRQVNIEGKQPSVIVGKTKCLVVNCEKNCTDTYPQICKNHKSRFDKYRITLEEFLEIPDKCDVCGSSNNIAIDHDHYTGMMRGYLCISCNTGLGKIGDTLESARNIVAYLERAYNV